MKKTFSTLFFLFIVTLSVFSQGKEREAIRLYEHKDLQASKVLFQEILDENPNHPNALEYLGNIAFDMREYEKASNYIKSLVDRFPNVARYHFKYAGAIGLYARDNKMKALFLIDDIKKHFHKAVELDEKFVDAHLGLVHLYLELPLVFGGSKTKALHYAKLVEMLDVTAGKEAMRLIAASN